MRRSRSRPAASAATETARTSIIPARQASDRKGCKMRRFFTGPGLVAAVLATAVLVAVPPALARIRHDVTTGKPDSPFTEQAERVAVAVDVEHVRARCLLTTTSTRRRATRATTEPVRSRPRSAARASTPRSPAATVGHSRCRRPPRETALESSATRSGCTATRGPIGTSPNRETVSSPTATLRSRSPTSDSNGVFRSAAHGSLRQPDVEHRGDS